MTNRGRLRKLVVAIGIVGASLAGWTSPAPAQAPDAQGWWWLAGATGIAPPGVPPDGLYVASNPSGTQGVSALRFELAGGASAGTLRLDLAGAPSGQPVIGLCQVTTEWEPVQGGPLGEAPPCVEGGATVAGQASADGQSYTFSVGQLAAGGLLNVAVVPGKDESGNNTTFSASFKKPSDDALTSVGGTSGPSGNEFAPAPEPSPEFTAQPSFNAPAQPFEPAPADSPILGPARQNDAGAGNTGGSGVASPVAPTGSTSDSSNSGWRIAGFVLLGLTALAYHRLSGMPDRPPRSLVTFGQLASEEQSQG